VLEHLLRNVRSAHVRAHFFKTPASAYTEQLPIRILSGTYNVRGLFSHDYSGLCSAWEPGIMACDLVAHQMALHGSNDEVWSSPLQVNGKPPVNGLDLAPWLSLFSKAWPARTREDAGGGECLGRQGSITPDAGTNTGGLGAPCCMQTHCDNNERLPVYWRHVRTEQVQITQVHDLGCSPLVLLTLVPGDGNADGPDVVAVGFQEIVPLHAGNVIVGEWATVCNKRVDWHDAWQTLAILHHGSSSATVTLKNCTRTET
jgi:hypothetical protein